jgi:hypothetical protein
MAAGERYNTEDDLLAAMQYPPVVLLLMLLVFAVIFDELLEILFVLVAIEAS